MNCRRIYCCCVRSTEGVGVPFSPTKEIKWQHLLFYNMTVVLRARVLPPLMLRRTEIDNLAVNGLRLLVLRWDGAQTVSDLVARHRNVFAFNAEMVKRAARYNSFVVLMRFDLQSDLLGNMNEHIVAAGVGLDESVTFAAAKALHDSDIEWVR